MTTLRAAVVAVLTALFVVTAGTDAVGSGEQPPPGGEPFILLTAGVNKLKIEGAGTYGTGAPSSYRSACSP